MPNLLNARSPTIGQENPQATGLQPRQLSPRKALNERSLSDLNVENNARPTIRLVNSDSKSSEVNNHNGRRSSPERVEKTLKPKDSIWVDMPPASTARPPTQDGPTERSTGLWAVPDIRVPKRFSISTTTSNAETLVADSLFSPTSNRFSIDSSFKSPVQSTFEGLPEHIAPLAPVVELDSELPGLPSTEDLPDIPQLPSSVAESRRLAHSSSIYSSSPFAELGQSDSTNSALGFHIGPGTEREIASEMELRERPSLMSLASTSTADGRSSTPHLIKHQSSLESIRPPFAINRTPYHSGSISSLLSARSMTGESLGQLQIPRKRAHMHSNSLNSHPSLARLRQPNLTTIMSEIEAMDNSNSMQLTPPLPAEIWPRRRRATAASSAYSTSISSPQLEQKQTSRTLESYDSSSSGLHSESAYPEPLFSSSAPIPQMPFKPSSAQITDEMGDTIGELQAPPLREKRSGYFVRKRSQTELRLNPKQSMQSLSGESDRWSTGTFIFPQWARFFYSGRAGIPPLNTQESRATLGGPAYGQQARHTIAGPPYAMINASTRSLDLQRPDTRGSHSRNETLTRPNSAMSGWETIYSVSPAASRFLGDMLRPLASRRRSLTDPTESHSRNRDSMSGFSIRDQDFDSDIDAVSDIEPEPIPFPRKINANTSTLPIPRNKPPTDKHPADRLSQLRGPRAIPTINGPPRIPASQSRTLRSYTSFPHLVPNRRLIQSLSAWRVPSIDEPFPSDIFGKGNRQILCFCLGFLFPPLWILAALLPLPHCVWRSGHGLEGEKEGIWTTTPACARGAAVDGMVRERLEAQEKWTWDEERRFLKARWWRNLNRVMSVVGVGILAAIITLAVMASGA